MGIDTEFQLHQVAVQFGKLIAQGFVAFAEAFNFGDERIEGLFADGDGLCIGWGLLWLGYDGSGCGGGCLLIAGEL